MQADEILKILRPDEWTAFQEEGVFTGSSDDRRDGFIHFSTRAQIEGTLGKYYTDGEDVIIAVCKAAPLGEALKWEISRGGEPFPHLYADLPLSAIMRYQRLPADASGRYDLTDL